MENIKRVLLSENPDTINNLSSDPIVMWVDWREHDEDIIQYCERIIQTGTLKAVSRDAENERGFDIIITYKEKDTVIPYGTDADRDTTIVTLNKVLLPEYEIRFCDWSFGNDTLAFIPLLSSSWSLLEEEFGVEVVRNQFSVIDENKKMFGLRGKELKAMLKKRGLL